MPKVNGLQNFCAGLSSALINPNEREATGEVRQRMKRTLIMMAVVVITAAKIHNFATQRIDKTKFGKAVKIPTYFPRTPPP